MQTALLACSPIGDHRIQHNDESRAVIVDHKLIRFSPTEYRLLKPLLNCSPAPITDSELVREAFACEMSNELRANLDKHIDNIRSKLRPSGLDVYRVTRYGYVLLAIPDEACLHLPGS